MEREHSPSSLPEDPSAERALERLASGWIPQDSAVADSGDARIREHLEALAMVAYELEPEAPRPAVKQQLMARIRASGQEVAPDPAPDTSSPKPYRSPVDVTLQHSTAGVESAADYRADAAEKTLVGSGAEVIPMRPTEPRTSESRTSSSAYWALAAALAFCLVGLGYLYGQINAKNAVISMQKERLESTQSLESELERTRSDLARMQDSLAMVASVAQTAYPLRPVAANMPTGQGTPRGKVFVCGQHQRWYLSMNDLKPAPEGMEYHLWFQTQDGMVDAGKFEVRHGLAAMRDLSMPEGTQGFEITLEPAGGGDGEAAPGKTIMIGDRPVSL